MPDGPRDGGFGIYVHWPFCQAKCPYCDFNSHVWDRVDQSRWAAALAREIQRYQSITPDRLVGSVYFGGGTPSLMNGETVQTVLDTIRAGWSVANDWEVTLEANPTSVEASRFADYRMAGINRISLGVQALTDTDLKRLGRLHSADDAMVALHVARTEFDRVSFDLIYARQDQSLEAWTDELDRALDLGMDHLSLYQLTIEPGTAFWDRQARGGLQGLPDEDLAADMYDLTLDRCDAAGLSAYEVSNLARAGAESRHNLVYWSGGEYVGVGPGAHGRVHHGQARWAVEAEKAPAAWLAAVEGAGRADQWTALEAVDVDAEYLMMGLRTAQGIDINRLTSRDFSPEFQKLTTDGLLEQSGSRIWATSRGRIVLNAVLRDLLT